LLRFLHLLLSLFTSCLDFIKLLLKFTIGIRNFLFKLTDALLNRLNLSVATFRAEALTSCLILSQPGIDIINKRMMGNHECVMNL